MLISGAGNASFVVSGSSKSMSWKTGAKFIVFISVSKLSDGISKSFGSGNSFAGCVTGVVAAGISDVLFVAVMRDVSKTECCMGPILLWARINGMRNSSGILCGNSFVFISLGVLDSGAGCIVSVAVDGAGAGSAGTGSIIFGNGIVNSGAFLRIIIVVVAMYNGIADSINNPNTKPGNPRNFACANRVQSVPENISKLNIKCRIAHIAKI